MTNDQLTKATKLATSSKELPLCSGLFDGYGLPDFKPVYCSLQAVAELIRWQCVQLNGQLDMVEYNDLARLGKKRFLIISE